VAAAEAGAAGSSDTGSAGLLQAAANTHRAAETAKGIDLCCMELSFFVRVRTAAWDAALLASLIVVVIAAILVFVLRHGQRAGQAEHHDWQHLHRTHDLLSLDFRAPGGKQREAEQKDSGHQGRGPLWAPIQWSCQSVSTGMRVMVTCLLLHRCAADSTVSESVVQAVQSIRD
jgi:hypothetical protein